MSLVHKAKTTGNITLALRTITKLSKVEPQAYKDELEAFYKEDAKVLNLIGTVINASLTSNKPCFMLSRSLMAQLVKKDNNLTKNIVLYPRDYKELLMRMMQSDIFDCLNPPSIKKGKGIAGLYRMKSEELRKYYKDVDIQELAIIKEYCLYQNIPLIQLQALVV